MDDTQKTIGLSDVLDEFGRDLDDLRKKHPSDYGLKHLTMWWEQEKERLTFRHGLGTTLVKLKKLQSVKRLMLWFFAGSITMMLVDIASNLVLK